jgi:hypothetical protein
MGDSSAIGTPASDEVAAYCFRCKMRKPMHAATETRMRNGRRAFTGTCVTCGTRMFKIAPPEEQPGLLDLSPPR